MSLWAGKRLFKGDPTAPNAVDPVDEMRSGVEVWETVEPSEHGIDGAERMALIRDDIAARVAALWAELDADQ